MDEDRLSSRLDLWIPGCTCTSRALLAGALPAELRGSSTMSAAYYAQFMLNGGGAVTCTIPATEHT